MVDLPTLRLIHGVAEIDPTGLDTWVTAAAIALTVVAAVRFAGPLLERALLRLRARRNGWEDADDEPAERPAADMAAAARDGLLAGLLPGLLLWVDRQAVLLHLGEELVGRAAWLTPAGWIILVSVLVLLAALAGIAVRQVQEHGAAGGLVGALACAAVAGAAMALGVIAGPAVAFWLATRPGGHIAGLCGDVLEPLRGPKEALVAAFLTRFG